MAYRHSGAQPVYAPNSYGGPEADAQRAGAVAWSVEAGEMGRYAYEKHADDDDFGQAGTLYREVMSDTDRDNLVTNIVGHASDHVNDEVQLRVIAYWSSVDPALGSRIAAGLGKTTDGDAFHEAAKLVESRSNRA
jgi:catalase